MGLELLFYIGLFTAILGWQVLPGLGGSEEDDDEAPNPADGATETSSPTDLFDESLYSNVVTYGDGSGTYLITGTSEAHFLGAGNDTLRGSAGNDFVTGGGGNDLLALEGGDDIAFGGLGNDVLRGGAGDDLLYGNEGNDALDGGAGEDTLYGGADNDTMIGGFGADLMYGGAGDDYLSGFAFDRANTPIGLDASDTLYGGAGNDTLHMGALDVAYGGEGNDTFRLDHRDPVVQGAARIEDYTPGQDVIEVWYTPGEGMTAPELTLESLGGDRYQILVDGRIVAIVTSQGGALTAHQVNLRPDPTLPPAPAPDPAP